jgi:hypothetical protein
MDICGVLGALPVYSATYKERKNPIAIQPRNEIHPMVDSVMQATKAVVARIRVAFWRTFRAWPRL